MNISPTTLALVAALSTLAGVVISSVFNLLNTRIAKQFEERKHQRELVMNAAVEHWKQMCTVALSQRSALIWPLNDYMMTMAVWSQAILDKKLDASNIEAVLNEMDSLSNKITEHRKKQVERDRAHI